MPWFYFKHIIDDDAPLETHYTSMGISKRLAIKFKTDKITVNLPPEE